MTQYMKEIDYERLAYELIKYLMKWGMWREDAQIFCGGKAYIPSEYLSDAQSEGREEEVYGYGEFYDFSEKQVGFRDLESVVIVKDRKQKEHHPYPLYILPGEALFFLIEYYEYGVGLKLSDVSDEIKDYFIETYELLYDYIDFDDIDRPASILDATEFDSYDDYWELEDDMQDRQMKRAMRQIYDSNMSIEGKGRFLTDLARAEFYDIIDKFGLVLYDYDYGCDFHSEASKMCFKMCE